RSTGRRMPCASRSCTTSPRRGSRCGCASRHASPRSTRASTRWQGSTGRRPSWSASATTCTASSSAAITTCARSCCTRASPAIRCARTTRRRASSRSCRTATEAEPPVDTPLANPVRSIFATPLREDSVIVNIGPSHPATHGTVQIIAELDGERVLRTDVHCGYLHRGFEKECEDHTWHNLIPYVDRLNYVSALVNDFAYCDGVERLMGIEITPRCLYLRTLLSEYSRLVDHLTCVAAGLMEMGAMTAFLYLVMIRDYMYEHLAALTGARVTYTYGRIGGLARDLPDGWLTRLDEILVEFYEFTGRIHGLMDRNRIFIDRTRDVGAISSADALHWGFTGPILRSTGAAIDLRKDMPYLAYAELEFDVPVGINGDNYDRYYVRMREMDESIRMIRQLVGKLPQGPICVDDRRCTFPDKQLVYREIQSLINHFKLVM